MSKNLLKIFNIIFPFTDFLYILQLEEYDNKRYSLRIKRFFFRRNIQKRDTLKYTSRIQATFILSVGIYLISLLFAFIFIPILLVSSLLIPLYILLANALLTNFYELMKYRLQLKAKVKVSEIKNLKVIAVAGSYGKTTTKNFIFELIKYNYRTQMVPGNINTPTGVAAWVMKELSSQTQVLLVEMDSYFIGEIRRTCMITKPDIAVITSIGDQHIERFGNQKNMAIAIYEVFKYANEDAKLFIFESELSKLKELHIELNKKIIEVSESPLKLKTNIESSSARKDLLLALKVSAALNIPDKIVKDTLLTLSLPDRRQKEVEINGYKAIDDSYNISVTTAKEGVKAAQAFAKKNHKKLLVITAGIPELAPDKLDENKKYGKFLFENADKVIVLKSIFHPELMNDGFKEARTMNEVWKIANEYSPKEYVLLMQPELTDLYY